MNKTFDQDDACPAPLDFEPAPDPGVRTILFVEDSKFFASMVIKKVSCALGFEIRWVRTFAEARQEIESGTHNFFVALVDLALPDAPHGEIVDYTVARGIPAIVFTGEFNDDVRDSILAKNVVNYILKDNPECLDTLVHDISRIDKNKQVKILIVDDSRLARKVVVSLLTTQQYQVIEAASGPEALEILSREQDILLAIVDYNMPQMDGLQLIKEMRKNFPKEQLAIIGISAYGTNVLSAKFIKHGANDFITKPFLNEEFYCRVLQNVETIERIRLVKDISNKDYLTGLFNRRHFFSVAGMLYANVERRNLTLAVAMVDIDFFKKVNDTYGHAAGDKVLKHVATTLKNRFRESDMVARLGGEEFCVLCMNMAPEHAFDVFEKIRADIEAADIVAGNLCINVTVSVGLCTTLLDSLEDMIKKADAMLYRAKETGRNQVLAYPYPDPDMARPYGND